MVTDYAMTGRFRVGRACLATAYHMWEQACSRKQASSRHQCCLTMHIREQARSHICFVLFPGDATLV
jgi:hypothetical protein